MCVNSLTIHPLILPLSLQDVVKLRGSVKQVFAADEMSTKMYETLQLCKASGGHSRTFGKSVPSATTGPFYSGIDSTL